MHYQSQIKIFFESILISYTARGLLGLDGGFDQITYCNASSTFS